MSRSRATVSLPCSCRMSGCSASTILASVASSASTVSATFDGAALGLLAELARGLEAEMPRRRRKEHEAHHVRAGLQRDVERLARGQAANFDDQGHGFKARVRAATTGRKRRCGWGGFYNVAPCLSRPPAPYPPPCGSAGKRCGSPREAAGAGAQIGQLRPRLPRIGLVLARRAPPVALPEPGRGAARHHAEDRHRDDDDEQRQRDRRPTDRWN